MRRLFAFLVALAPSFAAETSSPKTHRDYRAIAAAAYERKNYTAAKEAVLSALELLPNSPQYLYNLAALSVLTNDAATAYQTLREVAAFGVTFPIERERDFARLQGAPEFQQIVQLFAANREPCGNADLVAELPGRTGILEGIAFRSRTGDLFLGDVHHRCIWRRDRDGQVFRFSAEDEELLGIFAIVVDEPRNTLWAVTTAVPEMSGYAPDQKGHTGLAEFNLGTSELRRVLPLPGDGREHALGDLTVGPDGTVYATDAKAPIVWTLAAGAEDFQKIAESPLFSSLQGLALIKGNLFVADFANGLFKIEIATGEITELPPPKNTTLLGLDGLAVVPGGIGATQNGVEPQRVVRIEFNGDMSRVSGVSVLASSLPNLTDLTLITLINDRPTLIAGAGWDGYDPEKAKQPRAHSVRIFQVALP